MKWSKPHFNCYEDSQEMPMMLMFDLRITFRLKHKFLPIPAHVQVIYFLFFDFIVKKKEEKQNWTKKPNNSSNWTNKQTNKWNFLATWNENRNHAQSIALNSIVCIFKSQFNTFNVQYSWKGWENYYFPTVHSLVWFVLFFLDDDAEVFAI